MVKRGPIETPKPAPSTGILFECLAETKCPHCNAIVSLANAKPLSSLLCPMCRSKVFVPGRVGGFLLYEHIGEGEMGTIYRATDESLKRDVAVKLVRGCHSDDPESLALLSREACAAGKLNHPRVAQVHALNFSNGHPYLVMELVTGQDFAQKLEREGRIDERDALRMALDVADGLSALNREGLVHGDIKPGNIVLDRDGNAKLVDFGLSGMTRLDDHGMLMGTPNYIAPELLQGSAATHRSDLYSLGATLYNLLSGHPPFEGETPAELLKARLFHHPVPLGTLAPHVSLPTRKLVMRMLEHNPEKRQTNSDAVAADIKEALTRLDSPAPVAPGASDLVRRLFERLSLSLRSPSKPSSQRRSFVTGILCLIAAIEFLVAIKEQSFDRTFRWIRQEVADHMKTVATPVSQPLPETVAPVREEAVDIETVALPFSQPLPETASPVQEVFTTEARPIWQSMNLGEHAQPGSTLEMQETLIVQGTGIDMWKGYDRCRFVWTKVSSNYSFSAQTVTIADNNIFAITGLLVKGDDPALGTGLLFGFFGSGELFLQIRQPDNKTEIVKRSGRPIRLPSYLKIVRRGKAFEANVSSDGRSWGLFAACEMDLPSDNSIGFSVSAQDSSALATAKFSNIRLLTPRPLGAAKANNVTTVKPNPVVPRQ